MRSINSFAAAVHRLRREQGMRLGDIANKTSYSESYLSKLLHGHRPLLPAPVREIDEVLGAGGELERIAHDQRGAGVVASRPMQLPPAVPDFVARTEQLRAMDQVLFARSRPGVAATIVIEGGFWTGKTALAVQWAARVLDRFPGGVLFADLRGLAPGTPADPSDVLEGFLGALGAGADRQHGSLADRAARYRSLLAQRPAIVVLDNIAGYEQVQYLLPAAGSAVVITSREHQAGLLLRTGGVHIDLPALTQNEALTLLRQRIGEARVNVELPAAQEVVRRCGRLPMAVLIAAEHLQHHHNGSLRNLAEALATDARRLDLFTSSDPTVNIHGVIDLSYLALPPQIQRVFRLLGVGPTRLISAESTAVLTDLSVETVRDALGVLRDAHLVEDTNGKRMRMNHLIRAYAFYRGLAEEHISEVEQARDRTLRWYVATARAASDALAHNWSGAGPTLDDVSDIAPLTFEGNAYDSAMTWCETEVDTAIHVARQIRSRLAGDSVWMLPTMFLPYFYLTKSWEKWLAAASAGLSAAREVGSVVGIARCTQSLGWVLHELGRTEEGIEHLREAIRLQTDIGDDRSRAWSLFGLASAYAALDRHTDAREGYLLAQGLFVECGLDLGIAVTLAMLSGTHQSLGDAREANLCAYDALARAEKLSSKLVTGLSHHRLGLVLLQQQQYRPALTHFDTALSLRRTGRERWCEAETLTARAQALANLGDDAGARESYCDAATILESLHDPRALDIQAQIVTLNASLRSR